MSYFISVRPFWRPDQPQAVYKGALNLWEAPLYVPIHDASQSYRAPDAISDKTYILQTGPAFSWVQRVVDSVVSTWIPVFDAEVSYRSSDRWLGPIETQPEPAWIFSAVPIVVTVAQQWPAILEALQPSFRSPDGQRLDVRQYEWSPEFGWVWSVVDSVVRTWSPVWAEELGSFRTPGVLPLNVRIEWSPEFGWITTGTPIPPVVLGSICLVETVLAEPRTFTVPFETRSLTAPNEPRSLVEPAEPRTFTPTCCDC